MRTLSKQLRTARSGRSTSTGVGHKARTVKQSTVEMAMQGIGFFSFFIMRKPTIDGLKN